MTNCTFLKNPTFARNPKPAATTHAPAAAARNTRNVAWIKNDDPPIRRRQAKLIGTCSARPSGRERIRGWRKIPQQLLVAVGQWRMTTNVLVVLSRPYAGNVMITQET